MNIQTLQNQFDMIGARLVVDIDPVRRIRSGFARISRDFTIDIGTDKHGEYFKLAIDRADIDQVDLTAVDIQPKQRHLLLLAKRPERMLVDQKQKFLCGHDERHWFVASVPDSRSVARIADAMEALKPEGARIMQVRNGVKGKHWHARRNEGFVRQGEWFFLPRPDFRPEALDPILVDEPIRRGGGKPHFVEMLCRNGGTTVYVTGRRPNGLTQSEYNNFLKSNPDAASWPWQVMRRDPNVYAKGRIRHPDHATIILPFWHQVLMSREQGGVNVAFLD